MKILALDTSSSACSCALYSDGQIYQQFQVAPKQHNVLLLPMLEALLGEAKITLAQCDAIAFGCGPGSFTGLRIAAAVTQGLALAANKPIIPISTLLALAQGTYREFNTETVLTFVNAHMQEFYWAVCQLDPNNIMQFLIPEQCSSPQHIEILTLPECVGVGDGWAAGNDYVSSMLKPKMTKIIEDRYCQAHDIALLASIAYQEGRIYSAQEALPVYLRELDYKK